MKFEFATTARIVFGFGARDEIAPAAAALGRRVLLVTGSSGRYAGELARKLEDQGLACFHFTVSGEPTVLLIDAGVRVAREAGCQVVIAVGGGSVIDAGKAIAAMLTNPGELPDYLEVVGRGRPLVQAPVPCIAAPTTAGTGAEVTRNSVIGVPEKRVKVSLRSPLMLPRLAVVDPELTLSLPPEVTAATGLDALTQLVETFVSLWANPLTDGICREGITRVGRSLRRAWENGGDREARQDMALAGLFGGLALANAGLGAVHGIAGPLGGMTGASHGAVCARLLPFVMEANFRSLEERASGSPALARYAEVAGLLTRREGATAEDGIEWIAELCKTLTVPDLAEQGLQEVEITEVAAKSLKASSMKGNPVALTKDEIKAVLRKAL
ncbi:MAG TPA: iron-containing alcohol dehydrogenase [Candidatus Glassbacteria bacterium]|nr:iron-containing alcohol dehydrogenase [Candidatus Glassbacteria bacterium]